ncbi:MAG: exodeoxyribonuclease VII large subunit, partial [Pseudomonadota bacterium]|nr:exodeoxyribonuclease VII large subunit [Pseudomonadota bacterium]
MNDAAETPRTNVPELSVSELALGVKRVLEDSFGRIRVRGELSRVNIAGSGHMYSDLKDENAVINVVCWKGTMSKLSIRPEEGLDVVVTGRMTSYPQRSNYQLVIESMELAGEGALLKMLEERKKKLAGEGLFAAERKKKLPFLPQTIGVVTSPTGAVLRDIMHRLNDRFPRHVLVWPVLVQGKGADEQITAAIRGFNAMPAGGAVPRPDLIIVARGGGSLEDLMAFNEENVVRAAAESDIP